MNALFLTLTFTIHNFIYPVSFAAISGTSVFTILKNPMLLHVLVIHLFCVYGHTINHPLRALVLFLQYYACIDWSSIIVTTSTLISTSDFMPLPPLYDDETILEWMEKNPSGHASGIGSASDSREGHNDTSSKSVVGRVTEIIEIYRKRFESTVHASLRVRLLEEATENSGTLDGGVTVDGTNPCPTGEVGGALGGGIGE